MIDIKNTEGAVILSVSIASDGVITTELMKQDNITLSWRSVVNNVIPLGSYIEYEGERYSLLEPYSPIQISEVEYEYNPVFHSRIMRWQHMPFFHYNKVGGEIVSKEPDWTLTDNPANFMSVICDAIKNETGEEWTYAIAENLPASVSLSFSNVDIFSALNSIANEFQTEWWVDKANRVLHLSKASFGEPVILEVGNNIKIPSVTNSKNGYFTRFYAFGSTRNIAQDYDGANVNNQTNRRLTLDPVKYPDGYKDIRDNLSDDEIISKVLFFDNVYPKSNLVISNVRVRLMWQLDNDNNKVQVGTDENGNPIYSQYAIWYFKIPGYVYNEKNIIPGKPISVHFNSGALSGREFELSYTGTQKEIKTNDGEPFVKDADDYEILFIEEGSYIIPAITGLIPNDGDEITLFNIVMPEQYKQSAYDELETELDKEIARLQSDLNNYSFDSNPVEFFSNNPNLAIGRSVTYVNGEYSYNTRVIKLETNLDFAFEQKITIGNEQIKGNTQELKEEVVNANRDINLLASINEMTNSITQAYNRTQKALLDSMAAYGDMLEIKTLSNGEKILYTRYGFASEKAISWKGVSASGGGTSGGGLIQRVYGYDNITDVFDDNTKTDTFNAYTIAKIAERVSDIEKNGVGGDVDLTGYATEDWVLSKDYATNTAVATLQLAHNTLRSEFDALNNVLNDDVSGKINTWNEVVDFLDEYSGSQDLATILAGINGDISTLQGKFTKDNIQTTLGIADWALAASKPSYNFSEILNKPTTLAGYGITDALSINGGTINGNIILNGNITITRESSPLYINSTSDSIPTAVNFFKNLVNYGGIGMSNKNTPCFLDTNNTPYTLYHTGNFNPADYLPLSGGTMTGNLTINKTSGESVLYLGANGRVSYNPNSDETTLYNGGSGYPAIKVRAGLNAPIFRYNYTDYTLIHSGNYADTTDKRYLQLSGGTINGDLTIGENSASTTTQYYLRMWKEEGGQRHRAMLRVNATGTSLSYYNNNTGMFTQLVLGSSSYQVGTSSTLYDIIHSGNIGSYNVASAYKLITEDNKWMVYLSNAGNLVVGDNIATGQTHIIGNDIILRYGTTASYGFILNTAGNVLIGTPIDDGDKLQVNGSLRLYRDIYTKEYLRISVGDISVNYYGNDTDGWCNHNFYSNDYMLVRFNGYTKSVEVKGNISATGSISWGAASDRRLKDNIKTISNDDAINVIMALNPVTFTWNKTATEKDNSLKGLSCGFVADEFTKVIPNSSRPIWEEYSAIDYKLTVAFVVKGLQNHEERLRVLESENRELKNELNKLRGYGN